MYKVLLMLIESWDSATHYHSSRVSYYFKNSIILLTYKLDSSYIHCQACDREAWEKEAKLVFLISQGIRGHGPTRSGQGDKRRGMTFTPGLNHIYKTLELLSPKLDPATMKNQQVEKENFSWFSLI